MTIKPSIALRNEYLQISLLARESGEPIFITNKGEADGVYMSIEAYQEREKMLAHRASILAAGKRTGIHSGSENDGIHFLLCWRNWGICQLRWW